jgi:hypothetical protein
MKNYRILIILIAAAFLLMQCAEENTPEEKIIYSFQVESEQISGGRASSLDDVTAALVTLTDNDGNIVFSKKQIQIYQLGGSFVTEGIPLKPAAYYVTEFMLIDDNQDVLYATPLKYSVLAKYVSRPLPVRFVVSKNAVKNIGLQVLSAEAKQPVDFGYAAFVIKLMLSFQVSSQLVVNNVASFTNAELTLSMDGITILTKPLAAKVNTITFEGNETASYELKISKSGYAPFTKTFTYPQLIQELGGSPLQVKFSEALDATLFVNAGFLREKVFSMYITSSSNITVDWGDGVTEVKTGSLVHHYPEKKFYTITLSGDLGSITGFSGQADVYSVDLAALTNLESIGMFEFANLPSLDLRPFKKLKSVDVLGGGTVFKEIIMPEEHDIRHMSIRETAIQGTLFNVVQSLYQDAYFDAENRAGSFYFESAYELPEDVKPMLFEMGTSWGWSIYPEFDYEEEYGNDEG